MGECSITNSVSLLYSHVKLEGRANLSALRFIKSDRRSSLSGDTLDYLICISTDRPPLSQWDASDTVHFWWRSK